MQEASPRRSVKSVKKMGRFSIEIDRQVSEKPDFCDLDPLAEKKSLPKRSIHVEATPSFSAPSKSQGGFPVMSLDANAFAEPPKYQGPQATFLPIQENIKPQQNQSGRFTISKVSKDVPSFDFVHEMLERAHKPSSHGGFVQPSLFDISSIDSFKGNPSKHLTLFTIDEVQEISSKEQRHQEVNDLIQL